MRRFEAEARSTPPEDFEEWAAELMLFADCEGEAAALGVVMKFAPLECFRALAADQGVWSELIARARYCDAQRFREGVLAGRRVGL